MRYSFYKNHKKGYRFCMLLSMSNPGRMGLDSLLQEIEKLQIVRNIQLSPGLFYDVLPKIIGTYKIRMHSN